MRWGTAAAKRVRVSARRKLEREDEGEQAQERETGTASHGLIPEERKQGERRCKPRSRTAHGSTFWQRKKKGKGVFCKTPVLLDISQIYKIETLGIYLGEFYGSEK